MINKTGQRLLVVTENDGEILFSIEEGQSINVRSNAQAENDRHYSPKTKVNLRGRFTKVMESEKSIVDRFVDCPAVYMALSIMRRYIVPNYNVLMKNGKKYKYVDLAEDMRITRQMASKYVARLKQENIVAEVQTNKGKLLAINPMYYCKGDEVPQAIIDVFKKGVKNAR